MTRTFTIGLGLLLAMACGNVGTAARGDRFLPGAVQVNLTGVGNCSRDCNWPDAGMHTNLLVRERNLSTMDAATVLESIAGGGAPRSVLPSMPLMQHGCESGIVERW